MRMLVDEQKSPMRVLSVMERSLFGLFPFSSNPGQKPFKSTLWAISASINIFWIKDLHWVKPSYLYVLNPALRQTLNKLSTDILPVVWSIKSWYRSATGCCLDSGTNSTIAFFTTSALNHRRFSVSKCVAAYAPQIKNITNAIGDFFISIPPYIFRRLRLLS